jgi:hypothetical protein
MERKNPAGITSNPAYFMRSSLSELHLGDEDLSPGT